MQEKLSKYVAAAFDYIDLIALNATSGGVCIISLLLEHQLE